MLTGIPSGGGLLPASSRWFGLSFFTALTLFLSLATQAATTQKLTGHVPSSQTIAQSRLASDKTLNLAISLPLQNRQQLEQLISQINSPASSRYGQYLTPSQFAEQYGPSQEDYDAVVAYAKANGFTVTATHPNRTLVSVEATVSQIEKAFGVKMSYYQHPKDSRLYYAPDVEPTLTLSTPVLHVRGLNDYTLPKPRLQIAPIPSDTNAIAQSGSGPSGSYMGYDFRKAYVPSTTLTGSGEAIGLFEMDGYYASDIKSYLSKTGLPSVTLQNVLVDGFNGNPLTSGNEEVALDIEVAIAMAPGLSKVIVYEGSPYSTAATIDNVLNRMATDNLARQLSCSWGFDIDETTEQIFLQYAAQGQSFYLASGDNGAFTGSVEQPSDSPYITVVGGTVLSTTTSTGAWLSETAWSGSGGGISTVFSIPDWQNGVITTASYGSSSMRNVPDVSMVAYNVQIYADNGKSFAGNGTSISAPLWAAFTALANQRATALGKPAVGFINPVLYSIGKKTASKTLYHDITSGNNYTTDSPSLYPAVTGYDLCTGLGTPTGTNLIEAILGTTDDPLGVTSPLGFIAIGRVGGSFSPSSQTYYLTNTGTTSLGWSIINTTAWLTVSTASGTLASGAQAAVVVSLNSSASSLLLGDYKATLKFVNSTTGVSQSRQFVLSAGNAGFEIGDFTYWTFSGQSSVNFPITVDYSRFQSAALINGVNDWEFVGSGLIGAFLGQNSSLGYLSQSLPTKAGQSYILSFWYSNPATGTPNEFLVSWNGSTVYDGVNLAAFSGTTKQYIVKATSSSSVLKFGFRNDQNAFGLDDVSVIAVPAPTLHAVQMVNSAMSFSWTTVVGITYQAQYTDSLTSPTWSNLGSATKATSTTLSISDEAKTTQRFYRVIVK